MSGAASPGQGASPFSPRAVLGLVGFGALVFVALLYMIGSGATGGSTNNGGGHAGGKGLNGFAAFSGFVERRGYAVRHLRSEGAAGDAGLLVLTPPPSADGAEIDKIVRRHRDAGAVLVIAPKWMAMQMRVTPGVKRGWVQLAGTQSPSWSGFLDDVSVKIAAAGSGKRASWYAGGSTGPLPDASRVQSGSGIRVVPLVTAREDGRTLAGYINDGGSYPALEAMAGRAVSTGGNDGNGDALHPVIMVFEPDLLDNYGMADVANARLADRLVHAATGGGKVVNFDLTLNGFARKPNLLTLAFTPPFLAATLCLLMAALAVGWRAFLRFGPARAGTRAIAFGKRALVANAAGLIRRSRRLHLITAPYVTRGRERMVRVLALPRMADVAATEAAIDRAVAARRPDATPFSVIAARLRAARSPYDILKAAQDLHALERTLIR